MRRSGVRFPSAPPTSSKGLVRLRKSAHREPDAANCCTNVVHNRPFDDGSTRCDDRVFYPSDCCTSLVHKPSKTAPSPSSRTRQDSRRRHSGLIVRGRVFYLRVRVPRSLEQTVGRTHLWRSLGTGNWHEAIRTARIVGWEFEQRFRSSEGKDVRPVAVSAAVTIPATVEPTIIVEPGEKTLDDVFRLFLDDPAKARSRKTEMHYETLKAIVTDVWGTGRRLASIDREACRDLLEVLLWLPSNPTKRFPKLSTVQAAKMAKAKGLASTLSAASVNGYMTKLRTLFNFALNEGWIDRNPARGLRVVDPRHRRDRRLPFSNDQLRAIFNAPLYRGCVDDEYGYADVGPARPRRARFWVPLIALFSGMRMNEICQLDVADIRRVDEVDCFLVTSHSNGGGDDKKVKTSTSERFVPIHPRLTEIGFMDFVDKRRRSGTVKLFPELPLSTTGYYSDPFSKWFRRFAYKAKAARPKTCFHSFRHCFRDALREARIDHDVALALGGWSSGTGKENVETADAYGRGYRIGTLFEALTRLSYPDLDLSHLSDIATKGRC
jgi:integrase